MKFKQQIETLIKSNLKTYQDNSDRFIADYNRELELTKEYNGRQLLELLQNADDAASNEVLIIWDKANSKLTISNKGEPFEIGGIKSLMLANLSSKTKISYIGNKGLGFRSILNWAEEITINSNGCEISFSELIAKNIFDNQLNLSDNDKQKLRNERNLSKQTVPFPVLAIPAIEENKNIGDWTTSIEIKYRHEFETDIENQLSEIREEILLFLNNIRKITIQKGAELLVLHSRKEANREFESIYIKDKQWKVFSRENILPTEHQDKSKNETQSYNLKVAFQENLSDNYKKLFNFFPTQLSIALPCIIHGTFELNSSRNHLNDSKKNEYILKELVHLMKDCALYLTKQKVDWRPYKLISTSTSTSDSTLINGFYQELESLKKTEKIYPSINNEYNPLADVFYYNDEFNGFFQENFTEVLPQLLMPLNNELNSPFPEKKFQHDFLAKEIDELSATELNISLRAELITQLSKVITFRDEQERFSLLVNESGKVISKKELTFTPIARSDKDFSIPTSVNVNFMKSELYDLLISKFENGFDKEEARELQRCIKSVVNLQPYDSNNVIEKIITGTKDALKAITVSNEQATCIKEMVIALYANFKHIKNRQEKLKIAVPLISKANKMCDAEHLYIDNSYPSGEVTEIIYKGMLNANDYLASLFFWELKDNDTDYIESFFLWLGVNKYSKIRLIYLRNNWNEKEYIQFVFANGTSKPDNFEINKIQGDTIISKIERFDEIKKLPINQIILLALKDSSIRRLLEVNDEKIRWSYVTDRPPIITNYSYLRFQFLRSNLFTKYVLEEGGEDLNKLINENFQIDYDFLSRYGINKTEIKSILVKLGAKESFNDIAPEHVYEILREIPKKDSNKKGKATQSIYKMALESLVQQKSTFAVPDDIEYFARKGITEKYYQRTEVYYTDNSILPQKILNTLPMINLPKRSGGANVAKYFGVKSLSEFKIEINEKHLKFNPCHAGLNRWFESIKPYILAYRLGSPSLKRRITDNDGKRKEARVLKQCKIHVVTQCLFKFDGKEMPIDEKDFINVREVFYFKENTLQTVEALKKDSLFCDAFAEMMCIVFNVNELKNDFRQILKNDIQDTSHLVKQDVEKEKIEEAFLLLGISKIEINFWKGVFDLMDKSLIEPIETTQILKQRVFEHLGISISEEYENIDFENFGNKESYKLIQLLCNDLKLSVKQVVPDGLCNWHRYELSNCIKDNEYTFKRLVWVFLENNPSEQGLFISILNQYNLDFITQLESSINQLKFELTVDYSSIIREQVQTHFKIDLNSKPSNGVEIKNLYKALLSKYSKEDVDVSDETIRSLLFFKGNKQKIEEYLADQITTDSEDGSLNEESEKIIGDLLDASLSKNEKVLSTSSHSENGSWLHSGLIDRGKKRKGKNAERLVYNTLVHKYGAENVKWVSGYSTTPDKNDKLHYDLEYKNEAGEWKYVEVKAMSNSQFIISSPEKDKGISEPEKFEMALVNDTTIYMIKDIFNFNQGETFENNSKFVAYAKDYVLTFDIDKIPN
jgi:hypothetical protein